MTELFLVSLFIFVFFTLIIIPPGQIISEYFFSKKSQCYKRREVLAFSFGASIIFYSLVTSLFCFLKLPYETISLLVRLISFGFLLYWIIKKQFVVFFTKENTYLFLFFFFYFLLSISVSSFPDLNYRNVSPDLTERLLSLPVDNIIPYNFSRYLLEGISPGSLEVVSTWRSSDRGPIGGIMNAAIFYIMGLKEVQNWMEVSPGLYFIYQGLISYLNLFSILSLWLISAEAFGRRASSYSLLLLSTSCFFFVNTIFSWPKFLMAYFIFISVYMQTIRVNPIIIGLMGGAAVLSHDSGIFFVMGLGTLFLIKKSFKSLSLYSLGYVLINLPWIIFKKFFPPSPRLTYLHLFCDTRKESESIPMLEEISYYFSTNSLVDIINAKLNNFVYPFNPLGLFEIETKRSFLESITTILNNLPGESFHRFIWGFGIIPIVFLILSLKKPFQNNHFIFYTIFSGLFFISLISGCSGNTTNHHWAYPLFLAATYCMTSYFYKNNSLLCKIFVSLGASVNIFTTILYVHYHSLIRPILHGSFNYFIFQTVILVICLIFIYLLGEQREESSSL